MALRLLRLAARRLVHAVPILLAAVCLNFVLLHLIPGDTVDVLLSGTDGATPAYVEQLRASFGLDRPLHEQLLRYLAQIAQLNLGYSLIYSQPVLDMIMGALWPTLLLMLSSILLAFTGGVLLGAYSARHLHTARDAVISVSALLAFAMPSFWLGLMLIVLFSVKLGWFPVGGFETLEAAGSGGWTRSVDILHHLVLPMVSLAMIYMAIYARVMRASMLEVISLDFVRTARAKGLGEQRVMLAHVVRNALLPMVTLLSLQLGAVMGGSIVIESVFSWPGLGRLAQEAVMQRDYNLLLGILLFSSLLVILLNLAADVLYTVLDPRVEVG